MTVTDEDVDEMYAVLRLAGVYSNMGVLHLRSIIRIKLGEGKVPCFERNMWVPREKQNENI